MDTIRAQFASEEEYATFVQHSEFVGVAFAFRILWRNRVSACRHMTAADWNSLKDLAYRLGVDIPC